jgi:cell division septation protein DedD
LLVAKSWRLQHLSGNISEPRSGSRWFYSGVVNVGEQLKTPAASLNVDVLNLFLTPRIGRPLLFRHRDLSVKPNNLEQINGGQSRRRPDGTAAWCRKKINYFGRYMHFFAPSTLFCCVGHMQMNARKASEEQVVDEFRQLFRQQSHLRPSPGLADRNHEITARLSLLGEHIAAALERPSVVFVTASLCLVMLFALLMPSMHDKSKVVAAEMASTDETISEPQEVPDPQEEDSSTTSPLTPNSVAETNPSFIIRVGAFRNPVNAQRVVQSLRTRALDVKTETLASGLYVVTVGPFAARHVAEDNAHTVLQAVGLVPQILPPH